MAGKVKLKCPKCLIEFEYDPNSTERIITSLDVSIDTQEKGEKEVIVYLNCPNGHIEKYKVVKTYG